MPCPDCGGSVEQTERESHVCERERWLDFQMFHLREEVGCFEAQSGSSRTSSSAPTRTARCTASRAQGPAPALVPGRRRPEPTRSWPSSSGRGAAASRAKGRRRRRRACSYAARRARDRGRKDGGMRAAANRALADDTRAGTLPIKWGSPSTAGGRVIVAQACLVCCARALQSAKPSTS